jgi:hypothetical protein
VIGFVKVLGFLQDRDPGKTCLVDLQDQSLEQQVVILEWKTVLCIVIRSIEYVFGVGVAIIAVGAHNDILPS